MFSLYDSNGQLHRELFESLTEEQALYAFKKIKERLIQIQREKLAKLEAETPPLLENVRYKPRKRMPPSHVGYFIKQEFDPVSEADLTILFSRWSQGRPPKTFAGISEEEWNAHKVSKEEFYQKLLLAETQTNFKIVKSQLGYDEEGRTLEEFKNHMKLNSEY